MFSLNLKRRVGHRISIWALVFAMMLTILTWSLIVPASATNMGMGMGKATDSIESGIGEALSDVGEGMSEALSDVGEGMSEALSDIGSGGNDGEVNDSDGMIGNADSGADKAPSTDNENGNGGWIALAISIVVIVAIIVLIIVLIPRRKDNE